MDEQAAESEINEDELDREAKLEQWQRVTEDTEVISLTGEWTENRELDGGPRASALADRTDAPWQCRIKRRVKKYFGTKGNDVGQMEYPRGICSTDSNDIAVADCENHRIQIFDVNGQVKGVIGCEGTAEGQFGYLHDVCMTSRGRIITSDTGNNRIQIFDEKGKFVRKFNVEGTGDGEMGQPVGAATDDKGLIYVCDNLNHQVQVFTEEGKFVRKFGSESLGCPFFLSVTSSGRVVVSDWHDHRVHVFDPHSGRHLHHVGSEGANVSEFRYPQGVATDNHGNMIVCDSGNDRVQVLTSDGKFVTCFGSQGSEPGQMKMPVGVCVLSDGGIVVSDCINHRVQTF